MRLILEIGLTLTMSAVLMLWSGPAQPATLVWNANREPDIAGYRVYKCSQPTCRRKSGAATLLASLGKVTSFDIGTPAVLQFYVVTAYDFANNESVESNVVRYTPRGYSPPAPPSAPANLRLGFDQ